MVCIILTQYFFDGAVTLILLIWLVGWAINATLARRWPNLRAAKIAVPLIFGATVVLIWQIVVTEYNVSLAILPALNENDRLRLQIQCFANPPDSSVSSARRLSLARGLAIRSWLIDRGIAAGRMDIRALGSETEKTPVDRADLVFFDPLS